VTPADAQRGGRGRRSERAQQEVARPQEGLELARHGFAALAVAPQGWSPTVALTLVLPAGSGAEGRELPGSAWLLGETVRAQLARRLGPSGASARVQVARDHTVFQLIAAPGAWEGAYQALIEEVFTTPLDARALEDLRARQRGLFRFESGAPVRSFQNELYGLLAGAGSAWGRDPRGSGEAIERVTMTELNDLRRRIYRREQAVLTLVGAIDREGSATVFPGAERDGRNRRGGPAWSSGRRQRSEQEVTNIWIGAAFPARRDSPRTALEFLLLRLDDELNPVPRDPGLYGASVRLEELPDGPALVVEAAVLPEHLARWEARIGDVLSSLEERYRDEAFFELHRREFRNVALPADASPESQGRRMALDLLRQGTLRDLPTEIDELTAEQVLRVVDTLGEPRVLVFGPDLGGSG
jgi:predicted Zn-dependent peptidase